jgi:glutaminase
VLSGTRRHQAAIDRMVASQAGAGQPAIQTFADADLAREWCEDRILETHRDLAEETADLEPADHELFRGLDLEQLATLQERLRRQCYAPGSVIVRSGDTANQLFLIMSGRMSVTIDLPNGGMRRLSTLSDGMVFGELAFIGREARTADVRADTMVECQILHADDFDRLTADEPALACLLLANLLRVVGRTARRMTSEVALLAG